MGKCVHPTHVAVKLRHGWGTRAVEVLERAATTRATTTAAAMQGFFAALRSKTDDAATRRKQV